MGKRATAEEAASWALVSWLGVEEPLRGIGLGRYLLASGLRAAWDAGYRHALISTDWRNDRAFVFYAHSGFRLSDWTYILGRDL